MSVVIGLLLSSSVIFLALTTFLLRRYKGCRTAEEVFTLVPKVPTVSREANVLTTPSSVRSESRIHLFLSFAFEWRKAEADYRITAAAMVTKGDELFASFGVMGGRMQPVRSDPSDSHRELH